MVIRHPSSIASHLALRPIQNWLWCLPLCLLGRWSDRDGCSLCYQLPLDKGILNGPASYINIRWKNASVGALTMLRWWSTGIACYDRWPLAIATETKTDSPFLRLPLSGGGLTGSILQSRATTSPFAGAGPHTCLGVGRIQLTCFWSRGCWLKLHNIHTHIQLTAYRTTRHSWLLY